jgi:3-phenylpropionate/trans-cinnamate dioxygenase ferredoxin reductase component
MTYKRLVVGTDGSPTASVARDAALDLARQLGAEIVISCAWGSHDVPLPRALAIGEESRQAATRFGIEPILEVSEGEPAVRLIEVAEFRHCDLIVVGSKGMGHSSRFRLGSVADRVLRAAHHDVLIVRTTTAQGQVPERHRYRTILAATDGSTAAGTAVQGAFDLADTLRARVELVRAGDPVIGAIQLERSAALAPPGVEFTTTTLEGEPAEAICEKAERDGADLVVVGRRGMSTAMRYLLGSVSSKVAHYAPSDVLVVLGEGGSVDDIEPGQGAIVEMSGRKVAVYREPGGQIQALLARCTHLGCTVGWNPAARTWDCPCHGSRYRTDGSVLQGPATRALEALGPGAAPEPARPEPAKARRGPTRRFVIVGASLAGGSAVGTLREEGFDGDIVLLGSEPHPPYERPPLSKSFLRGETPFTDALVFQEAFYADNHVETGFGSTVVRIDTKDKQVVVAAGDRIPYDKLLLTTGARNRRPPIPGSDLDGVYDLRTVEDSERLRQEAASGRRAVVVGMGFIGSEVAASLRQRGVDVVAIASGEAPMAGILGPQVSRALADIHRDHGVDLVLGDLGARIEGNGKVEAVVTRSGRRLECDFVVLGLGVKPVTGLARGTPMEVDDGILVDELCRTTAPDVFAAGDVANHLHPVFGRLRVEHWQHARLHGAAAARSMMGKGRPYDEIHWFWSDQYENNLQYLGQVKGWDDIVIRGSVEDRDFLAFYLAGGRIIGLVGFNRGQEVANAKPLVASPAHVDPDRLRNQEVALSSLA